MKALVPLLLLLALAAPNAHGGDEDGKKAASKKAAALPEPTPLPEEPEAPDLSLGQEPEAPMPGYEDEEPSPPPAAAQPRPRAGNPRWPYDPDFRMDYSELMGLVDLGEPDQGVLPPAPGFRGYRPSMIAVGAGDRTPGYGGMVEFSWNRVGAGVFASYRNLRDSDTSAEAQGFAGLYGLYRWLPWGVSPYFLLGLELGSRTPETFGGLVGAGVEARLYSGWTALAGYTYHSVARKGFFGGAIGWSF